MLLMEGKKELKIGELAKMANDYIQTVRYYEKCGFLKPSSRLESYDTGARNTMCHYKHCLPY